MLDLMMVRLPEIVIIIYAISILLYFIDFIDQNRKVNRIAFRLLSIVWILQTIFLFLYMLRTGRFPVLTLFEGLYFYSWVLITLSLAIHRILKVDFTVFFTNILGFSIMAIHAFAPFQRPTEAMAEQLVSELLFIHITMAILSYGAFTLSFVFSALYLLQYKLLKEKKWQKRLWRLSDLAKLEKISYVLNIIGVPMLLLSLILGLQWAFIKLPYFQWYDLKIIGSFLLLIVYSLILYLHRKKEIFGRKLALWNTAAFFIILINFFLVSRLSNFHIWHY
ncbi:cytochrome c biogenesis protein [Lederbergia citrea]|uniref:Cytochrome c biogenesis protein CcsA n=1 Tax=Lederbergia citrea TaxID=2833581 RepID=A0A942Z4P0_9BACI|nr:cytochrome c biogenesis protein CcsA [Lederbergia citrea]MBS4176172.1 cytochrome c biogenesis protein CcsA [Lederbergia citrea]MBS4222600.1 cytochrome c biogenesis protein CcsA [Lederbergia citrea]